MVVPLLTTPGNPTEMRLNDGSRPTSPSIAFRTAFGVEGFGVGVRTCSATSPPWRSITEALTLVPPMSTPSVRGRPAPRLAPAGLFNAFHSAHGTNVYMRWLGWSRLLI